MTIWIDSNNVLHDDDNGAALSLPSWPQGMTVATLEQVQAITNPPKTLKQQTLEQIETLEQANPWTHRRIRDLCDAMVAAIKMANPSVDMSVIPGFAAVALLEAQIASMRANLK